MSAETPRLPLTVQVLEEPNTWTLEDIIEETERQRALQSELEAQETVEVIETTEAAQALETFEAAKVALTGTAAAGLSFVGVVAGVVLGGPDVNVETQSEKIRRWYLPKTEPRSATSTSQDVAILTEGPGRKTTAVTPGGPQTTSGAQLGTQIPGYNGIVAVDVWEASNRQGLPQLPHLFDWPGAPGSYGATHAERQALYLNPTATFVRVSRKPCIGCQYWISAVATSRGDVITLVSPAGILWFLPNGKILTVAKW